MKLRTRRKEKQKLPSGITADYSANFFAPLNRDETDESVQTTPPLPPRRGILKPPPILEHGPLQDLDSDSLLQTNTLKNELIVYENVPRVSSIDSLTDSTTNSSFATPFNLSPSGNEYLTDDFDENLKLPSVPILKVEPRLLTINRRAGPGSDFGFSLRRGLVSENPNKNLKPVIFAEPGQDKTHYTGLLPGDKLIEVNGSPVLEKNRDEIIDMIKSSETSVIVKVNKIEIIICYCYYFINYLYCSQVEPALELYELSKTYLSSQNGNNVVSYYDIR